jgi:hypothetical protein
MSRRGVAIGVAGFALLTGGGAVAQTAKVKYPEAYRGWLHLKTMVIHDKAHPLFDTFGGIHHVYVNATGAKAARAGGAHPDGSVLVFDLLEAKADGGAMTEGTRKFIGVMVKNAKIHAETGGWGFEVFKGDGRDERAVTDAKTQCFACHQSQRASDYVFSTYRK